MDRAAYSVWNARDVARLLALVENERRYYAEIIAELPVAVAIVSSDLELLLTNSAFRSLFQLKRSEILSVRLGGLQSGTAISTQVRAAFAANRAVDFASAGAFHISLTPIRSTDEPGRELLMVVQPGVIPASHQLGGSASTDEYDAIFWRRGGELQFESVSPQIEEILGYKPDQLIADPGFWIGTVHSDDRTAVETFYRTLTQDGRYSVEYRAASATGTMLRLRDAVRVRNGRISGMTLNVTNRGLVENDYLQSEKYESLNRLARRVTHDFNNLHMVIKGYGGEVLQALPPNGPAQSDMEEILGAAGRLAVAVEKLGVYVRRPSLVLAEFDINRFIEKFVSGLILPHGVESSYDPQPAAAPVHGDAENLEKILNWLVTLDAGGHIRIATGALLVAEVHADKPAALKPGKYTVISFVNSGPPLDPVASESALLRAHTVLRLMGGGFNAFSGSRGNTFQMFLPAADESQPRTTAQAEPTAAPAPIASKTVLVVEDEPGIRALIRKMLLRRGYQVLEAQSGTEGLHISTQFDGKIDLLITDLLMPQMNGRELVDKVLKSWPQTKVLFISGFTDDPLLDRAGLPASVAFLQKPFTLESLLQKVDQALAGASGT